jgi:cobaltochelatase CobT
MTTYLPNSELLPRAVAATFRALAAQPELEVIFGGQMGQVGKRMTLPALPASAAVEEIAILRGTADALALKLRHHHTSVLPQPSGEVAQAALAALEQARCEALGAQIMTGVCANLMAQREAQCRRAGFAQAQSQPQIPLAEALALRAFSELSGAELSPVAAHAVGLWRDWLDQRIPLAQWQGLRLTLAQPENFAQEARRLLQALDYQVPDRTEAGEASPEPAATASEAPAENSLPQESEASALDAKADTEATPREPDAMSEASLGDEASPPPDAVDAAAASYPSNDPDPDRPVMSYRVFTDRFDEEIAANELCSPEELMRLRQLLDQQVRPYLSVITRLANRFQRRLMAQQQRAWDFDLEEGWLDTGRLARIVASPTQPLSYKMERAMPFRDTIVTLLLDNSGSMRGRPITLAAMSADILARTLERCGVKVEILGFTTRAWKGGQSRDAWTKLGKPPQPGRLNDLRHIIYKAADQPWRQGRLNLALMLREGLLKENIDGEALLWARARLMQRREARKVLMVISDGAPVDDATLSVNPSHTLEEHLRSVIEWIEYQQQIELLAIGIGHDVTRYYRRAVTLADAEQLGGTMLQQLADLFATDSKQSVKRRRGYF